VLAPLAGAGRHFIHGFLFGEAQAFQPFAAFAPGEIFNDFMLQHGPGQLGASLIHPFVFLPRGLYGLLVAVGQILEPYALGRAVPGGLGVRVEVDRMSSDAFRMALPNWCSSA